MRNDEIDKEDPEFLQQLLEIAKILNEQDIPVEDRKVSDPEALKYLLEGQNETPDNS